ncbi:MAG: hypothetical protein PVG49_18005 [Desulfobacteraceae bacterium]
MKRNLRQSDGLDWRWNKRGDVLYTEASRDPGAVAQEVNWLF